MYSIYFFFSFKKAVAGGYPVQSQAEIHQEILITRKAENKVTKDNNKKRKSMFRDLQSIAWDEQARKDKAKIIALSAKTLIFSYVEHFLVLFAVFGQDMIVMSV